MTHRPKPRRRARPVAWEPWHQDLIGQVSDQEVADATGHSLIASAKRRQLLGVSAFVPRFFGAGR